MRTSDLARVQHDLPSPSVQIQTVRHGETCVAAAYLTLGPSNGSVTIKVDSVYTQTEPLTLLKTMLSTYALQIYAVTVKGTTVATRPANRAHLPCGFPKHPIKGKGTHRSVWSGRQRHGGPRPLAHLDTPG